MTATDTTWVAETLPDVFTDAYRQQGVEPPKAYSHGPLFALVSRDEIADDDLRWHVSLRYGNPGQDGRIPTWDELVEAAHALRPGVPFSLGIPPRSWWMSVHPHVLHLVETRDPHLVEQWRAERQGHTPS